MQVRQLLVCLLQVSLCQGQGLLCLGLGLRHVRDGLGHLGDHLIRLRHEVLICSLRILLCCNRLSFKLLRVCNDRVNHRHNLATSCILFILCEARWCIPWVCFGS